MKRFVLLGILALTVSCGQSYDPAGIWLGELEFSGAKLRVVFHIEKAGENTYTATMDSPDQSVMNIPVESVVVEGGELKLSVRSIGGAFVGRYQSSNIVEGVWKQGAVQLPLTIRLVEAGPILKRPQEPKTPYDFYEEEVSFENKKAGIKLVGSFTKPYGEGIFPCAILISGSGSQDRNQEIFGHKPFLVIAEHFARLGIATLRFDDRGFGKSTGNFADSTSEDFATDVTAALDYVKTRADVQKGKIGLVGHSEGGMIAPIVASQRGDVAFVVILAGLGISGLENMLLQNAAIYRSAGVSEEFIAKLMIQLRGEMEAVVNSKTPEEAKIKAFEESMKHIGLYSEIEKTTYGINEENIKKRIETYNTKWFRYFLAFEPKKYLQKVRCPVFAINGEVDLQVPYQENLSGIEKALKSGGNARVKIQSYAEHNHLFQPSKTGRIEEYGQIESTFSTLILRDMGNWIKEVVE